MTDSSDSQQIFTLMVDSLYGQQIFTLKEDTHMINTHLIDSSDSRQFLLLWLTLTWSTIQIVNKCFLFWLTLIWPTAQTVDKFYCYG